MREIVKGVIVIKRHCCCVPFDRENYEGCSEINERVYISRNWQVLVKTILLISCSGKIFCGLMREQKGTGKVSLRSWRYCLGARLTFWRRSCDKKREWGRGVWISISRGLRLSRRLRRQILLDYYRIPPATQATGRWNFQIWCLSEAVVSTKHFPINKRSQP